MPAIVHAPPSCKKIGPPESPEHTELDGGPKGDCRKTSVTAASLVLPARRLNVTLFSPPPHPAMMAVSPDFAARLNRTGTAARGSSSAMKIRPTSKPDALNL